MRMHDVQKEVNIANISKYKPENCRLFLLRFGDVEGRKIQTSITYITIQLLRT
jgi:hypothetical protein